MTGAIHDEAVRADQIGAVGAVHDRTGRVAGRALSADASNVVEGRTLETLAEDALTMLASATSTS
jgi:hypothetical protein